MAGIGVTSGIAIGRAYVKQDDFVVKKFEIDDIEGEIEVFRKAIQKAREQLIAIGAKTRENIGEEEAMIFEAHLLVLEDPELVDKTMEKIRERKINSAYALEETSQEIIAIFEAIEDDYIRERMADLKDVTKRLIDIISGREAFDFGSINEEVIIIARDLSPSDTSQLPRDRVLGFITELGAATSHTAIMSKVMGIPAIVSARGILEEVKTGDMLVMDGKTGVYLVKPEDKVIEEYKAIKEEFERDKTALKEFIGKKSVSKDGHEVLVACNIGTPKDLAAAIENDAEGIGLFRSEFLYMDRSCLPSEEEQFAAYRKVAEGMKGRPVIIRTLDVGGDKELHYLKIPKEDNPFLGFRAIRYCLAERETFRVQLRAILRASAFGKIKIMFPMISGYNELLEAKAEVEAVKKELCEKGIAYDKDIATGIMIETPSAAIISDILAEEADFFSIGTNDLVQYVTAVDRMNSSIANLGSPFHPAVLRLIKLVIDNGHKAGIEVGMCGGAAEDEKMVPILLGIGLDEFSVSPPGVLRVRRQLATLDKQQLEQRVPEFLNAKDSSLVKTML